MSFNLLDAAKGLITNEMVNKASSFLGESETGISKAIGGILPSLITGIAEKASTKDGAVSVVNMASQAHNAGMLSNIGSFFGDNADLKNKGTNLLSGLFGDSKLNILQNLISNFSGIKSSSAGSLLSMAAPLILGLLGKHASSNNLQAGDIASLLSSQKNGVLNAMPKGLGVDNFFSGLGTGAGQVVNKIEGGKTYSAYNKQSKKDSGLKWLLPLLLLAFIALAAWYFLGKGCNGSNLVSDGIDSLQSKTEQVASDIKDLTVNTLGKLDSLTGDFTYDLGEMVSIDLPNGAGKIEVGENSTENKLYKFLMNKDAMLDTVKGNWFEFTNVHFKTGGTQLDSSSVVQLKNMVSITKAFPTASFKIGGYTDNTGDSSSNVVLSQKRAEMVVATLKKLGAANASLGGAKGYGPQWPIADNNTPEGRALNRRVAVNVKAK